MEANLSMITSNIEWLNQNSQRNYPFYENTSRMDNTGEITIPNYFLVDLVLTVPSYDNIRVYLSDLSIIGNNIIFTLKDSDDVKICSLTVDVTEHTAYKSYLLSGETSEYSDVRGKAVLGNILNIKQDIPDGQYIFTIQTTELESCIVKPDLRGVRSVTVESGNEVSSEIFGRLNLKAGSNIKLTYLPADNAIRIDAVSQEYNAPCDCVNDLYPPCIRTINGINSEEVEIHGDGKCVEVTTSGNRLVINDICSEPCCGCTELEYLNNILAVLTDNLSKLESYYTTLNDRVEQFVNTALYSV